MAQIKRLAQRSSLYFVSNLLVVLCGAISLPLWTRLFTREQYGLFALFNVTITFMAVFSKFGMQHAALRFYSEAHSEKSSLEPKTYFSTTIIGATALSLAVTAVVVGATWAWLRAEPSHAFLALLLPAGAVVVVRSMSNVLMNMLRAEQKATLHAILHAARRYGRLVFALAMVLILGIEVRNIYLGWLVAAGLLATFLTLRLIRLGRLSFTAFSPSFFKQALAYSFPMIWLEVSNSILTLGDRYVLQYVMGAEAVGVYSVGYNTGSLAQSLLARPLRMAIVPMYLALWAAKGTAATTEFLGKALRYYCMLGVPLALTVTWYREEIITLLVTSRFIESAEILPFIIAPLVLYGGYGIFAAGLYIHKKTSVLMYSTIVAAVVNVLLNLVLVPRYGLLGAALATLIAYVVLAVIVYVQANRLVAVPIDLLLIGKVIAFSLAAIGLIEWSASGAWIGVRLALVGLSYLTLMLALDPGLRRDGTALWSNLLGRLRGTAR
jgi:O-antigen/teichoic acid export membrane protein